MEEIKTREKLPQPKFEIKQEKSLEFIAQSIQDYEDVGDEEAVFMLALTLDHPEWKDTILEQIKKDKPHVQGVEKILERLNRGYFHAGWQSQIQPNAEDAVWWAEHLPEKREQIAKLLAYFRPSVNEIAKKVVIVPSDKLLSSIETGCSFQVGDTTVIMSHTKNPENFEHEFLHSIINPLTEQLEAEIPQEKVIALASDKLKKGEGYGDHALSLLNEELIRAYHEFFRLKASIDSLDENSFTKILNEEPFLKERLSVMEIKSLTDFKTRRSEFYNKYEKNELRRRIYNLYEKFNTEKSINPEIRFKDFLAKEIKELFD